MLARKHAKPLSLDQEQALAVHNLQLCSVVDEKTTKHTLEILPIVFDKDLPNATAAWKRAWGLGQKGHMVAIFAMQHVTASKGAPP